MCAAGDLRGGKPKAAAMSRHGLTATAAVRVRTMAGMAVGEGATAAVEEETSRPFEAGCGERRLRGAAHRPQPIEVGFDVARDSSPGQGRSRSNHYSGFRHRAAADRRRQRSGVRGIGCAGHSSGADVEAPGVVQTARRARRRVDTEPHLRRGRIGPQCSRSRSKSASRRRRTSPLRPNEVRPTPPWRLW